MLSSAVARLVLAAWGFEVHWCKNGRSTKARHPRVIVACILHTCTNASMFCGSGWRAAVAFWGLPVGRPRVPPRRCQPTLPQGANIRPWAYVLRQSSSGNGEGQQQEQQQPIVFMHGIGIGLMPYLPFIRRWMLGNPGRPIVLLPMDHVALRLAAVRPSTADECAENLATLLHQMVCLTCLFFCPNLSPASALTCLFLCPNLSPASALTCLFLCGC